MKVNQIRTRSYLDDYVVVRSIWWMETKNRNVCVSEHKTEPKPKNQKIIQYGWWNVRKLVRVCAVTRFQAIDTLVRPLSRAFLRQHSVDKALACNYEDSLIKVIEAVKRQVI